MIRLLDAGITRLKKDKLFWIINLAVIGMTILVLYNNYSNMIKYNEVITIDKFFFFIGTILGLISSIFIGAFLGTEYSNGTLRNKIIIGHKRSKIYLSNFIITSIANIVFISLSMLVVAIVGIPLIGKIQMPINIFILFVFDNICLSIAYSAIFTFISMISSNKTTTIIIGMIVAIIMLTYCTVILNRLCDPETVQEAKYIDGEIVIEEVPNPRYLSENERRSYTRILDIIPTGQAFNLMGGETNFEFLPLYSLGVILVFTILGIKIFDKKELK